jgi:hypothetical protein
MSITRVGHTTDKETTDWLSKISLGLNKTWTNFTKTCLNLVTIPLVLALITNTYKIKNTKNIIMLENGLSQDA